MSLISNRTLTAVGGLRVGHASVSGGRSGCTVILGPFRAAAHVLGQATGTRELGPLDPEHLVPRIDALLLTGGSALGLGAADGVAAWLEERGTGFEVGPFRVPIVPAAVIFDLADGVPRPDAGTGRAACEAAGTGPVEEGRVGAGAGATVGKLAGRERAMPGGVGSWAVEAGGARVAALAVVNALGNVMDAEGGIVAGVRDPDGAVGANTTLCVVAADTPLAAVDLRRLARMASTALPRRIVPVHTPFDGDIVFALCPPEPAVEPTPADLLRLGEAARVCLEEAVTRAVTVGAR